MSFRRLTEFVACAGFGAILSAPHSMHAPILCAELGVLAGLFVGYRYGRKQ